MIKTLISKIHIKIMTI